MAITIGICDDNPMQLSLLLKYLEHSSLAEGMKIIQSVNPVDFIGKLKEEPAQLVFLDIDMGEMSGIELGRNIKRLNENTIIIYVTAHEKYALEAFEVRAFHYLLKPLTEEKFIRVLEDALNYLKQRNELKEQGFFTYQTKGEMIRMNYHDIFYFEKVGRKIKIRIAQQDQFFYGNFTQLLRELPEEVFLQCHQGYIANIEKVRSYREKTLFLEKDFKLPVSRSFSEKVKEILTERLFAGKDLL